MEVVIIKDMENKKICLELGRILKITESWGEKKPSHVEKDIVLEKLREVYAEIKCGTGCGTVKDECPAVAAEDVEQASAVDNVEKDMPVETYGADNGYAAPEQTENAVPRTEATEEPVEESALFSSDEIPVKPKLGKKVLLSLYGDENEGGGSGMDNTAAVEGNGQVDNVYNAADAVFGAKEPLHGEALADVTSANARPVLGEVMGNGGETLADAYAKNNHNTDVATVIGSGKVNGLRSSIGINDKFLMVRDMFGGDNDAYEAAVNDMERFNDLDEALLHIHETYDWNPNSDGVKFFIDLLTKKLS